MSGDAQPKRRKEKKKKKEDAGEETILQQTHHQPHVKVPPSVASDDNMDIHVQKESVIGGGYCAKFIFIMFLGAIATFLAILVTEPQKLNELGVFEHTTQISEYFGEWMDVSIAKYIRDDDTYDAGLEQHEREEDVADDDYHGEDEHEQEEDEHQDEEDEGNESPLEEDEENEASEDSEDVEAESNEIRENDEDDDQIDEDEEQFEEEEVEEPAESNQEVDEEETEHDVDQEEYAEDEDTFERDEEEEEPFEQDASKEIDESPEKNQKKIHEKHTLKKSTIILEDDLDGEDDEDQEELEDDENVDQKTSDHLIKHPDGENETDEDADQNSSNMVIKFGVGAALLVVAHIVLVRKWRTANNKYEEKNSEIKVTETEAPLPEYARRNTIVLPPNLEDVEQDIDTIERDVSTEEEEDEDDVDEEIEDKCTPAVLRFRELQSTYSHCLTPDGEPINETESFEDSNDENDKNDGDDEEDDDDDEEDEENEESDEDEDEDLLRRLEEKYGMISASDEEEKTDEEDEENEGDEDDDDFLKQKIAKAMETHDSEEDDNTQSSTNTVIDQFESITNPSDYIIKDELDNASSALQDDLAFALTLFDDLCKKHPHSPRSLYGKATALDSLAERNKSNKQLLQAIEIYRKILKLPDVPAVLFKKVAERCVDRMRFGGFYNDAININQLLIDKFPNEVGPRNQLVVNYLIANRLVDAKRLLQDTLRLWPANGFALVHYGFVIKILDNNLLEAVDYLKRGINSKEEGVIDGRFYFHLGDALTRLGRTDEAYQVYSDGAVHNLFPSAYQRSLYNVKGLKAKPWWTKQETTYAAFFEKVEQNWKTIRDEGLNVLSVKGYFKDESENLRDVGEWKQFELFARGSINKGNCARCPLTCKLIESFPDARFCKRGQAKFSVMHPGTHVWPHCGPTNCRLRSHLGLQVPNNTYIRVGNDTRSWNEGEIIIFDDSFDHEVWHNGTEIRLILIIDVWHPDLSKEMKRALPAI